MAELKFWKMKTMQAITVHAHVGHDGRLRIDLPIGVTDQDVEAIVVVNTATVSAVTDTHTSVNPATLGEWLELARQSRAELRAKYGSDHFNTQEILDEIREESSEWPRKS